LRSLEDYKNKIRRGKADLNSFREIDQFYEFDNHANVIVDESIMEVKMLRQACMNALVTQS
jgi:hypothetical protein